MVCSPTLGDLQVAAQAVNLVLVTDEPLQKWICFLEDTASCPPDPERSIQGPSSMDENCVDFSAPQMTLPRWICNEDPLGELESTAKKSNKGLVLFKCEIT